MSETPKSGMKVPFKEGTAFVVLPTAMVGTFYGVDKNGNVLDTFVKTVGDQWVIPLNPTKETSHGS